MDAVSVEWQHLKQQAQNTLQQLEALKLSESQSGATPSTVNLDPSVFCKLSAWVDEKFSDRKLLNAAFEELNADYQRLDTSFDSVFCSLMCSTYPGLDDAAAPHDPGYPSPPSPEASSSTPPRKPPLAATPRIQGDSPSQSPVVTPGRLSQDTSPHLTRHPYDSPLNSHRPDYPSQASPSRKSSGKKWTPSTGGSPLKDLSNLSSLDAAAAAAANQLAAFHMSMPSHVPLARSLSAPSTHPSHSTPRRSQLSPHTQRPQNSPHTHRSQNSPHTHRSLNSPHASDSLGAHRLHPSSGGTDTARIKEEDDSCDRATSSGPPSARSSSPVVRTPTRHRSLGCENPSPGRQHYTGAHGDTFSKLLVTYRNLSALYRQQQAAGQAATHLHDVGDTANTSTYTGRRDAVSSAGGAASVLPQPASTSLSKSTAPPPPPPLPPAQGLVNVNMGNGSSAARPSPSPSPPPPPPPLPSMLAHSPLTTTPSPAPPPPPPPPPSLLARSPLTTPSPAPPPPPPPPPPTSMFTRSPLTTTPSPPPPPPPLPTAGHLPASHPSLAAPNSAAQPTPPRPPAALSRLAAASSAAGAAHCSAPVQLPGLAEVAAKGVQSCLSHGPNPSPPLPGLPACVRTPTQTGSVAPPLPPPPLPGTSTTLSPPPPPPPLPGSTTPSKPLLTPPLPGSGSGSITPSKPPPPPSLPGSATPAGPPPPPPLPGSTTPANPPPPPPLPGSKHSSTPAPPPSPPALPAHGLSPMTRSSPATPSLLKPLLSPTLTSTPHAPPQPPVFTPQSASQSTSHTSLFSSLTPNSNMITFSAGQTPGSSYGSLRPAAHKRRTLHWEKVKHMVAHTVWNAPDVPARMSLIDEKTKLSLDEIFAEPDKPSRALHLTKKRRETVMLIDNKRTSQIGVMLKTSKLTYEKFVEAIKNLDLKRDVIDNFMKCLPTPEEMKKVLDYTSKPGNRVEDLCEAGQLFYHLRHVRDLDDRMKVMEFNASYGDTRDRLSSRLGLIHTACAQLIESTNMKMCLMTILGLGNHVNRHKEQAEALKLNSLRKLTSAKTPKNKDVSLLHLVVATVQDTMSIPECTTEMREAAKLSFELLRSELQGLVQGASLVEKATKKQEALTVDARDATYLSKLHAMMHTVVPAVEELQDQLNSTERVFLWCAEYYCADDGAGSKAHNPGRPGAGLNPGGNARVPLVTPRRQVDANQPGQMFSVLLSFLDDLGKASKESARVELARKMLNRDTAREEEAPPVWAGEPTPRG